MMRSVQTGVTHVREKFFASDSLLGLVAASTALGLAALGAALFLNADEAQTAAVLADDAGALDALVEAPEQLLEALGIALFNPHA